ncbi:MAG: TonB-dependent receptor [Lunatimonas sp.]|uniref:outer membrane beta-barrel protein n=1 Tax=Lunatimonas sp. TaxID=2060141 RepID=UPI00263A6224|nr:outer membrane beta-barrel protein [Lunatimonas sp.]MCC5938769.1 TonB-dependent receptor [Lunatimonas sp.]
MRKFSFLLLVVLSSLQVLGQDVFTGKVLDKQTKEELFGAYVFLKTDTDETLSSTFTDFDGTFSIKKPKESEFVVEISFIGYKTLRQKMKAPSGSQLGTFEIESDGQEMEAFEISADALGGEVRGDTVAFNAAAFKTRPEADADELVRKMPGVVIQNGVIQVQGEDVKEILVDGRPFFGDNPAAALKNLPAEVIERVEFLDRRSDESQLTGVDDGETVKTINIITKPDRRAGRFGKFYGGYGTDGNYLAGGNMNFFNGPRRLSILGLSNNINQQNFGADDLGNLESDDSRRGGGNELTVGNLPGITNTNALGANFSDEYLDEKMKVTGSYLFNNRENVLNRNSSREYILPNDSLQLYNETRFNQTTTQSHRMNFRIDYKINEKHAIILRPRFGYDKSNSSNIRDAVNLFDRDNPISRNDNITLNNRESMNFGNSFIYRYRFAKKGRALSASVYTSTYDSKSNSDLIAVNENFLNNNLDSLIQFRNNTYNSTYYSASLNYFEPLSEKSNLRFNYRISNNLSDTDQQVTAQEQESGIIRLDSALTNMFENSYMTQWAGLGYSFRSEKVSIYSNFNLQSAKIDSDRLFPGFENTQREFTNFLPRVVVNYQVGELSSLRIDYNTQTTAPTIRQLQDVISNANPLQVSNGNPDLDQEFSHRMFIRFRRINPETNRSFMVFLYGNFRNDFIGNETFVANRDTLLQGEVLLPQGGQFSRPVNLDNYWFYRGYMSYGFPLRFMKSNISLNSGIRTNNRPGIINGTKNFNRNTGLSQGINLSSNINERVDFNLSTTGNYTMVRSSLQPDLDNNFYTHNTRADLFWNFVGGVFIGGSANHLVYSGLGEDFDQSILLANLEVGFRIPPSRKTEIKLTVFDLLNQNTSIDRNVTDVFIEDVRTQVLRQYFMLTLTYNLRRFGGYNMNM